jgi:tetratricopeptide (TPR) repeat protein
MAAPDFSLPDAAGKTTTLKEFRGKLVLLQLWIAAGPESVENLKEFQRSYARLASNGLQFLAVNVDEATEAERVRQTSRANQFPFPVLFGNDDVAGIYNILYRQLFDRHRDLELPTSFLINEAGDIVKIYQGSINPRQVETDLGQIPKSGSQRVAKALPFPGIMESGEFRRNYLSYGSIYFQRGYLDQSEASFQIALHDDPQSAEALYGLGSVYLKQEKMADARKAFERATKLAPGYPETLPNTWNNLGLIAAREGRTDDAISNFHEALRLSPEFVIALVNLGNAYRQKHQWEEAGRALEQALAVTPEEPEANYSLGMVFAQTGDNERAYEYLQKALQYRPGYPEALNNLGVLYLRTKRRDQAVASFEECIRVSPGFDQSYLNLANVYAIEGDTEKARAVLLELLNQHPGHAQAQKALAQLQQ